MSSDPTEEVTFEDLYEKLQQIVDQLEEGGLSLSESLQLYENGVSMATQCKELLLQAEHQIDELIQEGSQLIYDIEYWLVYDGTRYRVQENVHRSEVGN